MGYDVASKGNDHADSNTNERYAQLAFLLLNIGIWLVVAGSTFRAGSWVVLAGRLTEASAVILFAVHTWKRIVSREGR